MENISMTQERRGEIISQSNAAFAAGDEDEAYRLLKLIPLAPHLVEAVTELFGADALDRSGFVVEANNEALRG